MGKELRFSVQRYKEAQPGCVWWLSGMLMSFLKVCRNYIILIRNDIAFCIALKTFTGAITHSFNLTGVFEACQRHWFENLLSYSAPASSGVLTVSVA